MSVVDEIKGKLDIVEYIQRYVPLKKAGRSYKACCPFHMERTPSFVVDDSRQSWRCYGSCATGGDIFGFAMKFHGWTFPEALQELGKLAGVEVRPQTPEQKTRDEQLERLRGLVTTLADFYHERLFDPQHGDVLAYARKKRGLTSETLRKFGIGYAPHGWDTALNLLTGLGYSEQDLILTGVVSQNEQGRIYDRFRHRLMIPIRDERGRVIGFGARALDPDDNPKYLNSPQTLLFDKSRVLFGLDLAKTAIRESETAVIVEGYLDAIQAHQAGYANVVAQMGTAMTEAQLKQIAPKWAKKIVIALDADAAGQSATMRGLEVARETLASDYSGKLSVDLRILAIPDAKDPDDLLRESPEQWGTLVEGATPVTDYVIAVETANLMPNATLQEREKVARRLLPILLASEDDLYRQDNLQKLALKLHIAERDLLVWANEQRKIRASKPPRSQPARPAANAALEPPDMPPPDYEALAPPEGMDSAFRLPAPTHEAALEAGCLRILFQQPDLYYHVNRKFRELAGDQGELANGLLGNLCAEDFIRGDYQTLMLVFQAAIEQDQVDVMKFVRKELDPALLPTLDLILIDEVDGLRDRLRYRLPADLAAALKQNAQFAPPLDLQSELTEKALRLRRQRLQRECQEMAFLQREAHSEGDETGNANYQAYVRWSMLAQRRIDAELKRQTTLFHQL